MDKVFCSNITRDSKTQLDDLYKLLTVPVARPVSVPAKKNNDYNFQHKTDKHFIPKKKNKFKVLTVRDVRNNFEKAVQADLQNDLEKQQNLLLRVFRSGPSRNNQTNILAKNILHKDEPITRTSWQMLMNINPDENVHSSQFVLWNGKCIKVNGSKGGKNKFLCNRDLNKPFKESVKNNTIKNIGCQKKKTLLRNSLSIHFKPGPLTKKRLLDKSFQKFSVGNIELVNLPKPGLEIQPKYGTSLDSSISNFLNNIRDVDESISRQWAEFAVSVLGTMSGSKPRQLDKEYITFDLNYKNNHRQIIMRRDQSDCEKSKNHIRNIKISPIDDIDIASEVRSIMNQMLDAVDISLNQDKIYSGEDQPRIDSEKDATTFNNTTKDKGKRKYGELDRLDVRVIRLPESENASTSDVCQNAHCTLGCVCDSLQCDVILKKHCGRIDCMFDCKCNFSKYKVLDTFGSNCSEEYLPGLLNLNNELRYKLSREEQKFHQTVIVSGDRSMLLKSQRRTWKTPIRYADYYSNKSSKNDKDIKRMLTIIETKLNCDNIEPWCMVHNLYKCFCKGKFTQTSQEHLLNESDKCATTVNTEFSPDINICTNSNENDGLLKSRLRKLKCVDKETSSEDNSTLPDYIKGNTCSRLKPYTGRKHSLEHYMGINNRICDMESNDSCLSKRLAYLINKSVTSSVTPRNSTSLLLTRRHFESTFTELINQDAEKKKGTSSEKLSKNATDDSIDDKSSKEEPCTDITFEKSDLKMIETSTDKCITNKPKLVAWLESSYKQHKKLEELGHVKTNLEAPRRGKVALHHWDFVLARYRERKNLFLVSKQPPFRIFICVDKSNPLFKKCMSIDDIKFADLHKYPATVKNLVTNTTNLKDNFCILFGSDIYWELVGTVMKINEPDEKKSEDDISSDISELLLSDESTSTDRSKNTKNRKSKGLSKKKIKQKTSKKSKQYKIPEKDVSSESSKWFLMTVENDFTEIQFYNKGFFVKYESIIRAINVGRMSGKTVRLSSQICADNTSGPQFGMYAIPATKEDCVFVGPYETEDNLGIEIVKVAGACKSLKRTRGVWIYTNKIDNLKVIDNPLLFIPDQKPEYSDMLLIEQDFHEINKGTSSTQVTPEKEKKIVKPIKIKKSNGFYKLSPNSVAKDVKNYPFSKWLSAPTVPIWGYPLPAKNSEDIPLTVSESPDACPTTVTTENQLNNIALVSHSLDSLPTVTDNTEINATVPPPLFEKKLNNNKPIAEVAPQIKITAVYSNASSSQEKEIKRTERGMLILRPEEINQRLLESKIFPCSSTNMTQTMDIETFIDSSIACSSLDEEAFVISDEDESSIKNVWIKCRNIESIGMIPAKMDRDENLSFEFPGFRYTDFYTKDEAFMKINQVLSRKVLIPKSLKLVWHIVDSLIDSSQLLKEEELHPDMVLTKTGLVSRSLLKTSKSIKTYSRDRNMQAMSTSTTDTDDSEKMEKLIYDADEDEIVDSEIHTLVSETSPEDEDLCEPLRLE